MCMLPGHALHSPLPMTVPPSVTTRALRGGRVPHLQAQKNKICQLQTRQEPVWPALRNGRAQPWRRTEAQQDRPAGGCQRSDRVTSRAKPADWTGQLLRSCCCISSMHCAAHRHVLPISSVAHFVDLKVNLDTLLKIPHALFADCSELKVQC
jgi:hypothetical protein